MKVTAEIYAPSYAPIVESFHSLRDAVAYCADPSSVVPIGGEPHPRSYWPCWPETADEWEPYRDEGTRAYCALVHFGEGAQTIDHYPDRIITVGPRGGYRAEQC